MENHIDIVNWLFRVMKWQSLYKERPAAFASGLSFIFFIFASVIVRLPRKLFLREEKSRVQDALLLR